MAARNPLYWYNVIITEKNTFATLNVYQPNVDDAQTLLSDIDSPSKAEDWRLVFWCVAVCAYVLDVMFQLVGIDLEAIVARSRYGTLPWYVQIAKEYQHGDALTLIDLQFQYATLDVTKQIVTNAAAQEGLGIVNLKVARTLAGVLSPLTGPQVAAFTTYINKRKPAGIKLNVINDNPDDLKVDILIDFDPLVLAPNGEMISSPGVFPVEDARAEYLKNLDFNGGYEIMIAQDYLQKATGVKSAYITFASARYGVNPFVAFTQRYFPNAGYLVVHASSTITYNASV